MKRPLYMHIASRLQAIENCRANGNTEWLEKHHDVLDRLCKNFLPRGSGIDNGTWLNMESSPERLVFATSYHHMNDVGSYDGWTDHTVIVTPCLTTKIDIKVTGRDRNDIKDFLGEVFYDALLQEIDNTDAALAA